MNLIETIKAGREALGRKTGGAKAPLGPLTCPKCRHSAAHAVWRDTLFICPECSNYLPIDGPTRLAMVFDHGTMHEFDEKAEPRDLLGFPGYTDKLAQQQNTTGLSDAALSAVGKIDGMSAVVVVLDSRFFMGSMGTAVGERVTRAIEHATAKKLPLIIFSASGGARMQEGIYSLMQMAKTSAAVAEHAAKGGLYISVMTNPTTGGVTASFASLGDIILAEPGALIGFAGPRVIEQTIKEKLPEGFQRAEFQEEHGFVDAIVERKALKATLAQLLRLHDHTAKGGKRA